MGEKLATWRAESADVSARGCRLILKRPLAQGALVRLSFDCGGAEPFEAVGQVVWARSGEPPEAGVMFVSAPRSRDGSSWLDVLAGTQARPAERDRPGNTAGRPASPSAAARAPATPPAMGAAAVAPPPAVTRVPGAAAAAPPGADSRASAVAALIAESLLEFEDEGAAA